MSTRLAYCSRACAGDGRSTFSHLLLSLLRVRSSDETMRPPATPGGRSRNYVHHRNDLTAWSPQRLILSGSTLIETCEVCLWLSSPELMNGLKDVLWLQEVKNLMKFNPQTRTVFVLWFIVFTSLNSCIFMSLLIHFYFSWFCFCYIFSYSLSLWSTLVQKALKR